MSLWNDLNLALHNAFEINYPEAMNGVVALVNIGHETTNINILDDGVPVLTRDIPVGTRRFKEDLQRERGLSARDATGIHLRIEDGARVGNHRGEKRGFARVQIRGRFVKVVLRRGFRAIDAIAPFNHIQIEFEDATL